ncbi:MAG: ACP S-malonyltransferase [Odoribacter sp.]|nr:ACP S-malonyltransferase [Odoribacter sp.]
MKKAFVFPGQGAQFVGMGKELYETSPCAKELFETANDILGFRITDLMFSGTDEDLKQTKVTQPAIFLHSVILADSLTEKPDMAAGHSLGEFSALVATGALSFEEGLRLVYARALAMQKACEANPSTMAVVLGMEDEVVANICEEIDEVVVPANYNSPRQIVISGSMKGIELACAKLSEAEAKRVLPLKVGGAFHSPLMEPARQELAEAINNASFKEPICPIYQNVDGLPYCEPAKIKENLVSQLTASVKWTQIMQHMIQDGADTFLEIGPGNVLQGLLKKVSREIQTSGIQ